MEKIFNSKEINANLTKLLAINRRYPRTFSTDEYHDVLQSIDETAGVLSQQLRSEYVEAISKAREIDSGANFLAEIRKDEQDMQKLLTEISNEYRELQLIHDSLIAQNANLKNEQQILKEVEKGSAEKIQRVLSNGSPANETSIELFGKPFGEMYNASTPSASVDDIKAIIDSARQKREQEIKQDGKE